MGTANLFLINPNGIIFGPNASLNIGGSFVATTANAIQFGNQGFFSASTPNTPQLLTVNPNAFLFNQIAAASIQNNSVASAGTAPTGLPASGLRVPDGRSLLLLGGNVNVDRGLLNAFGGRVELGGLASPGTVGLQVDGNNLSLAFPDNVNRASVSLTNIASVRVDGAGGGSIAVNARNLDVSGGSVLVAGIRQGLGSVGTQAGDITLNATGEIKVVGLGSRVFNIVQPQAVGKGGNIIISSSSLSLTDGARLSASTNGQGQAGSVSVRAIDSVTLANASIVSTVAAGGVGKGGDINISAATLSLTDSAQLVTSVLTNGQGQAGEVNVRAIDSVTLASNTSILSTVERAAVGKGGDINISAATLSLTDSAQLLTLVRGASSNLPAGRGDAGNVNIDVTGAVTITGAKGTFVSGIMSQLATGAIGKGGNINISSGSLSLTDGAGLSASSFGQGQAGEVNVRAIDSVTLANASIVSAVGAGGVGKGGDINISATTLSLIDGAGLQTRVRPASSNLPAGRGEAGNVNIDVTGAVTISGGKDRLVSGIFSDLGRGAIGKGGNITISSGSFSLTDGALLTASTSGQGNAGTIQINAADAVSLSGTSTTYGISSGLYTSTGSSGRSGDITINTRTFSVSDGALLDAQTVNDGDGGNMTVSANRVEVLNGGQLLSTSSGSGRAGKITVNTTDSVIVNGSDATFNDRVAQFTTEVVPNQGAASGLFVRAESTGSAGDIEVSSPKIWLDNSGRFIAESESGNGGNITLQVGDLLLLRRGSLISATAGTAEQGGDGGNITINAPSGFVVAVPREDSNISANAFTGRGGKVEVTARGIFGIQPRSNPTALSDITASSERGVAGTVELITPDIDPSRGLVELPTNLVDASGQIDTSCNPGSRQRASSLIVTGRGGLPLNPREAFNSDTVRVDWVTLNPSNDNRRSQTLTKPTIPRPAPIVEATGWVVNSFGEVELIANVPTATPHSSWQKHANCNAIQSNK